MQAYKLRGTIDRAGQLIVNEPLNLSPGEVEVIILQAAERNEASMVTESQKSAGTYKGSVPAQTQPEIPQQNMKSRTKAFRELLENAPLVPPDFDSEQAKWEYLQEKHNL